MDKSLRIRQEGNKVLLIINGVLLAEMPWQSALEAAQALNSVAKLAEEYEKHDQVSTDAAILARAGANFGLANHAAIKEEARMKALYDRELRRAMKLNDQSKGVVGAPTVNQTQVLGAKGIGSGEGFGKV